MKPVHPAALGAAVMLALGATPVHAEKYVFTTIDVPGADYTTADGINDLDQIVGRFGEFGKDGRETAFIWAGGAFTYFKLDPGHSNIFTFPIDINNRGVVVGEKLKVFPDRTSESHVFKFRDGTVREPIPADSVGLLAINRDSTVVGTLQPASGPLVGFTYRAGVLTTLPPPKADAAVTATAINDRGDIAGFYAPSDRAQNQYGFIYSEGNYKLFDPPRSDTFTTPLFIGEDLTVAGYFRARFDNVIHGFVRRRDGTRTTHDVPGATGTYVTRINQDGRILGFFITSGGLEHDFVYADGVYHEIRPPGADVYFHGDVNAKASFVGSYQKDGVQHAFIATCPGAPGSCVD